ncbi:MAG: ankyrin repeat domain-containing protein [Comamonas sp.]
MPNLVNFIANEQWDIVDRAIDQGIPVNVSDLDGYTPLILSVVANRHGLVDQLIAAGANLDYVDGEGFTALMLAVHTGRVEICRSLVSNGAGLDYINDNGNTALMLAVEEQDECLVELLLDAGAYVNHANEDQESALGISIRLGCERITAALKAAGADDSQLVDLFVRGELLDNSAYWDEDEDEQEDWSYEDEDSSDDLFGSGGMAGFDRSSEIHASVGEMHGPEISCYECDMPSSHGVLSSVQNASTHIAHVAIELPSIALVGVVDLNITCAKDHGAPAAGI